MRGRAHQLFQEFERHAAETRNAFGLCRVILLARVIPEHLTPELDDPELEERIERAILVVMREQRASSLPPTR